MKIKIRKRSKSKSRIKSRTGAACAATSSWNPLEFPTKNGHEVKGYSDCSYSTGDTYPSEE